MGNTGSSGAGTHTGSAAKKDFSVMFSEISYGHDWLALYVLDKSTTPSKRGCDPLLVHKLLVEKPNLTELNEPTSCPPPHLHHPGASVHPQAFIVGPRSSNFSPFVSSLLLETTGEDIVGFLLWFHHTKNRHTNTSSAQVSNPPTHIAPCCAACRLSLNAAW